MSNYLYILCRNDMASMGAGKTIAQGAHVANDFMWKEIHIPWTEKKVNTELMEWVAEAGAFGTTITLSANVNEINECVRLAKEYGFIAGITVDPEYHIKDGETWHIVPNVITGAYVFGDKEKLKGVLSNLELVSNEPISK